MENKSLAGQGEMKLEQFLARLAQTPRDWYVTKKKGVLATGLLRRVQSDNVFEWQCPISALCGMDSWEWEQAADKLKLSEADADAICLAADEHRKKEVQPLRAKLLKACGL